MGDWPLLGDVQQFTAAGALTANSSYTITLAHANTNTKGAWAQAIAATLFEAKGIILFPGRSASGDLLMDLALGPAGSEQIILNNLFYSVPNTTSYRQIQSLVLPIGIPVGSRIAIRSQCSVAASIATVPILLIGGGFSFSMPLSQIDTYGAATADSGGQVVDPGASVNTKGAWVELSASCYRMKMIFLAIGSRMNTTVSTASWLVDVAIGAAGYEEVLIPNLPLSAAGGVCVYPKYIGPFPISIPAGTRISVRAQCDINDASDRLFDVVVYGMR